MQCGRRRSGRKDWEQAKNRDGGCNVRGCFPNLLGRGSEDPSRSTPPGPKPRTADGVLIGSLPSTKAPVRAPRAAHILVAMAARQTKGENPQMRLRTCLAAAASVLLAPFAAGAQTGESPVPRPLSVLFFGDRGHHRSADRYEQIAPVLAGRGIEVTYTEKVSDLNPETLKKYGALLIYANTTRISKDQEKALLDYVGNGGGFVPLHCASFCFLNSPEYIALVGAQFQKHGTGEFETTVVDPNHPIIKGLEPFRTWDETYVHTKHNTKDRYVLQTRNDQSGSEPWTWTRARQWARLLHRIRPRRPHLGPPRLP